MRYKRVMGALLDAWDLDDGDGKFPENLMETLEVNGITKNDVVYFFKHQIGFPTEPEPKSDLFAKAQIQLLSRILELKMKLDKTIAVELREEQMRQMGMIK